MQVGYDESRVGSSGRRMSQGLKGRRSGVNRYLERVDETSARERERERKQITN